MVDFKGFPVPKEIILLSNGSFEVEIWPEIAGSVARFDAIGNDGSKKHLFRPAEEGKTTYTAPDDMACFPLVPYSNRIANGKMSFNGKDYDIALNVEGHPHALHGTGWQRPWKVVRKDQKTCHLVFHHTPDKDWPFSFAATQTITLHEKGLRIDFSIKNASDEPMPYGFGLHPYVYCPKGTHLQADVKGVWQGDRYAMPVEYTAVPEKWNLPDACLLDDVFMDHCFEPFYGPAKILWPDNSGLEIVGSDNLGFLVIYNPTDKDFVCVEPVSHMVDAFNRYAKGDPKVGFTTLNPYEEAHGFYEFTCI